jgi:hypothetical protein
MSLASFRKREAQAVRKPKSEEIQGAHTSVESAPVSEGLVIPLLGEPSSDQAPATGIPNPDRTQVGQMPASVSVERGEKLAIEPELLPPISFPRQQMIEAGVRDMRTLKDANIQSERESIAAALERELRGLTDTQRRNAISDIIAIRTDVAEIDKRYCNIACTLYTISKEAKSVFKAITRNSKLLNLDKGRISKLRTIGQAIYAKKVQIDWLPRSMNAAYEIAKLDQELIERGRQAGQIGRETRYEPIRAWIQSQQEVIAPPKPDTVDSIDTKIRHLRQRQQEIQEEANMRIREINIEIHDLEMKRAEVARSTARAV